MSSPPESLSSSSLVSLRISKVPACAQLPMTPEFTMIDYKASR